MNTTTNQTTTARRRVGATMLIGGLLAAVAVGASSARTVAKTGNHQGTTQPTPVTAAADAGLDLVLGSHYPTAVSSSAPLASVRLEDTVCSTDSAVGAPSTRDPGLGVLFGSTAQEAAWAGIRYSPNPGLSLLFSELYPVK